jgi:hypothetical protein
VKPQASYSAFAAAPSPVSTDTNRVQAAILAYETGLVELGSR